MNKKAVALFSGGLDSTLAVLVMQKQNIDVPAITFLTDFGCIQAIHHRARRTPRCEGRATSSCRWRKQEARLCC